MYDTVRNLSFLHHLWTFRSNIANPKVPPRLYNMVPSLRAFVQQLLCKVPEMRLGGEWCLRGLCRLAGGNGADFNNPDISFEMKIFARACDGCSPTTALGGVEAVMKDSFFSDVDWKVLSKNYYFREFRCSMSGMFKETFRWLNTVLFAARPYEGGIIAPLDSTSVAWEYWYQVHDIIATRLVARFLRALR